MGSVGGFDGSHVVNGGGLRIDAGRVPGCSVVPRGQCAGKTGREDEAPCCSLVLCLLAEASLACPAYPPTQAWQRLPQCEHGENVGPPSSPQ